MKTFRKVPLALAIAALVASPFALAENGYYGGDGDPDVDIEKDWETSVDVDVEKDFDFDKDVDVDAHVFALGLVFSNAFSQAYIESNQVNEDNEVLNYIVDNNARVNNSGSGASGNVGINTAAGDNNQQANDAALALVDAQFVFASAEVDSLQTNTQQAVENVKVANNATVNNSLNNVSGNLGLNVAAGNNNQQHNALAAAVNTSAGNYAEADIVAMQHSQDNYTANVGQEAETITEVVPFETSITLTGTYDGTSDQIGDVFLDTWGGVITNNGDHPCCQRTGHIDVDDEAQGAQDLNDDGGAFAFNEAGDITLEGTVTGNIINVLALAEVPHLNNASLSGSLNGVSGNVGVNIAAGTGNQQRNALAISAATGGAANGGNGGGGEL